ncbi:DUF6438 domain-containing protein [Sphingomonas soli]|uniref:DUF6438 domain-containing protein n=1 Tax=Sphingomonas soli TaxID=266127 RepID=UPI000B0D490C|nr:DUF6438 domain-containing protein [Sphingomonas soli]
MRHWVALGAAALVLAGCARDGRPDLPDAPVAIEGDSIRYETGPCFGVCPVYVVTLRPDGTGIFEGKRFTAATGTREFKLSRSEYEAFAAKLAPYRPKSGTARYTPDNKALCRSAATDLPSADITWTRAIGDSQSLAFYFGCDMDDNQDMAEAIGSAPETVRALEALIGERP